MNDEADSLLEAAQMRFCSSTEKYSKKRRALLNDLIDVYMLKAKVGVADLKPGGQENAPNEFIRFLDEELKRLGVNFQPTTIKQYARDAIGRRFPIRIFARR